jgi:predicted  nucleic acid-binding Zn-ribbon protein
MPHQCVHCGHIYPTASKELLEGCKCGGHFFYFVKEENINTLKEETAQLTKQDKQEIEEDIREIIGLKEDEDIPVVLDFEAIHIPEPGKFEIDLINLLKKDPLVYRLEEGRYIIDVASSFQIEKENKKKSIKK